MGASPGRVALPLNLKLILSLLFSWHLIPLSRLKTRALYTMDLAGSSWQEHGRQKPYGSPRDTYDNEASADADSRLEKALPPSQLMAPRTALYPGPVINRITSLVSQSSPSSLYLSGF